jgi:hypothetical protein
MTPAAKIPGWGLVQIPDTRAGPRGGEALILAEDGKAPFWAGLKEVRRHQGRIIYRDTTNTTQEGT